MPFARSLSQDVERNVTPADAARKAARAALTLRRQIPKKPAVKSPRVSQGKSNVPRRPRNISQRRVRCPRRHLDREQGRGSRCRGPRARTARQGRGARRGARGERQVESQSVAEEGGAA